MYRWPGSLIVDDQHTSQASFGGIGSGASKRVSWIPEDNQSGDGNNPDMQTQQTRGWKWFRGMRKSLHSFVNVMVDIVETSPLQPQSFGKQLC